MNVAATPQLSPLKRAFLALEQADARLKVAEAVAREPIAVIGLGCRVPGADDPAAFWRLLRDGVDAVGPVPDKRFDLDTLHATPVTSGPAEETTGKSVTKEAGFLRQVDQFDPVFFGITRREAHGMDPQQRLLLEVSWEALENAGKAPDTLERSRTGVYFGVCSNDYANLQLQANDSTLLGSHYASGLAHSVASGRVSYMLGLQGPSITVDTACSSSLVAVHLACQALRAGDCQMALAGGANMLLSSDLFVAFSNTRMLATDGRCKAFDASADGFGRGEGCGVVVLRRLSDAKSDGDRILAIIRGSAVNQDGPSSGLTVPNGPAQEAVIREALAHAGVAPRQVSYVEAHGTGTQLGDPLEVQALGAVFSRDREDGGKLLIGSVKTNFGHLEAAAGVSGLIKLILSLQQRAIPPHLHFREPNPHIAWDELALRVPTELTPWPPIDGRRIGGVSSFGFSGTNAHLVVEEAPEVAADVAVANDLGLQLFLLSAKDQAALAALARRYANAFALRPDEDLANVCFTAAIAKAQHHERAAVLARSMSELIDRLNALADGRDCEGVRIARVTRRDPACVAFLFTGQGAQYVGMARQLDGQQPVFRAALDRCAAVLDPLLQRPLRELLFSQSTPSALDQTGVTQPALFALEYALSEMWRAWGVVPQVLIGHSVGELVAACVAGAISLEDALRLTAERGRLMQSLPAGGAMAAVSAPESVVAAAIQGHESSLAIAAINGPAQSVISGDAAAVRALCDQLASQGVRCQALGVSHAFHSPLVDPVLDAFEAAASEVVFNRPRLRIISNLDGQVGLEEVTKPRYWRRHMREAVRFADGIKALAMIKPDVCVEIGPQPTLLSFVSELSSAFAHAPALVATLRKGRSDHDQIAEALAALFIAGVAIDWRAVWAARPCRVVDLPSYPFQRERCWFRARSPSRGASNGKATGHPLLGLRLRSALTDVIQFEQSMSSEVFVFLRDHQVHERAILPGTAFLELATVAGREALGYETTLRGLTIADPLVFERDDERIVQTIVRPLDGGGASFEVLSTASSPDGEPWRSHAQGTLEPAIPTPQSGAMQLERAPVQARCSEHVDNSAHYSRLAELGLAFGPSLKGVRNVWRRDGEAIGEIELPDEAAPSDSTYLLNPALLDACLQCLAWAMPEALTGGKAWLPFAIDQFVCNRSPGRRVWSHVVMIDAGPAGNNTLRADVSVYDDAGLVAELRGIALRPVVQAQSVASPLYEVVWQIDDREGRNHAPWMPSSRTLEVEIGPKLEPLAQQHDLDGYYRATVALDAYCGAWIAQTLRELGWSPKVGDRVRTDSLAERLRIAPRFRRLLVRLLDILTEDGLLARDNEAGESWVVSRAALITDAPATMASLRHDHPASTARLKLLQRCAECLPALLRGEADPLQLLFPNGSDADAQALYQDSPEANVYNQLARDAVQAALRSMPAGRSLRVLEVGGGTGGTTSWIAPVLPERTEYMFTDVGPLLVAKARERFAAHSFMKFETFDLEKDAVSQGIVGRQFDLIIAANVVHATADLRTTLGRLRDLLVPGGMLLLVEITGLERWIDVTFGLTDGWWRFTDSDLRANCPLVGRATWLELLSDMGFEASALNPTHRGSSEVVIAARRPIEYGLALPIGRRWLVLADVGGVGSEIAQRLRADGAQVTVLRCQPSEQASADDRLIEVSARHDLQREFTPFIADVDGVVHLWGLDLPVPDENDPRSLLAAQHLELGSLLGLVQALGAQSFPSDGTPRLWIGTRGAQTAMGIEPLALAQSPVWGMGRVIALEHSDLCTTCVDLDPDSSAVAQATDLLAAMAAAGDELQVAVRGGRRYLARLSYSEGGDSTSARPPVHLEKGANGLLEYLSLRPATRRPPGPAEIEIRVLATSLNFRDLMNAVEMRSDPEPLGGECAGRVTAVGPGVTAFAVGDDVVAVTEDCFATFATCDIRNVAHLPLRLSHGAAATLPFAFMTAHHALFDLGEMKAGDTVLIHAAAGGVGSAAVQLALRAGAIVIATTSSEAKRAHLLASGVHHVLNSRTLDFVAHVLDLTEGRGAELVLNSLAGDFIGASVKCLAPFGCFLEIGKRDIWTVERFHEVRPNGRYHAIDLATMRYQDEEAWRGLFVGVIDAAARGDLQALPMRLFPLERAADAFRCMAQARHIGKIVLTQCEDNFNWPDTLLPDATYLVTGGLSGLGLATAAHLAGRGARYLVLIGRRAPSAESVAYLDALRSQGVQIHVIEADISNSDEVARVLSWIKSELPPLRGVIHSAGVLADAAILQQDWAGVAKALRPKVDGSWALHVLTKRLRLDFFVMYSSVASVFGSAGQVNHAAANAFMDALAIHRRALGLPALSISWGAWRSIGSAADPGLHDRLGLRGIGSIVPERGLEMFDALMRSAPAHVVACPIDWPRLLNQDRDTSFLRHMRAQSPSPSRSSSTVVSRAAKAVAVPAAMRTEWLRVLNQAQPARREDMLRNFVGEQVASVIGLPDGLSVDQSQPLNERGLDSLMAVELRNRLSSGLALQRNLPATLVFDRPTIDALVGYLSDLLFRDTASNIASPVRSDAGSAGNDARKDAVGAIDGLSEDEIEEMFARKLRG